ncbi:MetQ/NlpA family ABC transporter substrate-binding protein [Rhodocyclus gracilis]|uniref:Lipoprotein n=1 Tax=Rhodocyclus tenuis TaxID=1066 RepID=A0A6L5JUH9_RHOTE|nr:MetQ/NlpA family ABC transporter substrate-binding protein [Rhodocyclus gracilis]MQY50200.1 metal ABC transporter substrate-binding protein [Rhodocyclus gracilis]
MKVLRSLLIAVVAAALPLSLVHADDKKALTIGATAGPNYDQLKYGIKPVLEKQGYHVKLVEFNDYVQPNLALASGSLDANLFQHVIYLRKFSADQKLDLVDVTQAPIAPLGLYSKKAKSLAELKEGARITLPNDPSNLARALVLLEQNGVVKLKPGIDPLRATEKDLAENPKKIQLLPIEAAQLPRTLDDADFSLITGNFAIASGLKLQEAVVLEKTPDYYLNVVAVRSADKDSEKTRAIVAAFHSPEYRHVLDTRFPGYARPSYLK